MSILPIIEADYQRQIVDLARYYHWRHHQTWISIRSPAGFPDLVLVHVPDKRLVFIEVKSEKGKLSPEQRSWLWDLAAVAEVYVLKPSDWNLVMDVLSGAYRG